MEARQMLARAIVVLVLVILLAHRTSAATLDGNALAYRSTGSSSGSAWILDRDGYLGTYVTLAAPGSVTIDVNASGTASGGVAPHMSLVVADSKSGFNVASGNHDYSTTYSLPAGTFFVRTQFDNDLALTPRQIKINSVSVTGGTLANNASSANALAASDTYIANYRRGQVSVDLAALGLPAGTPVTVSMKRLAFNWGNAVPGDSTSTVNAYMGTDGTAQQTNYQAKLLQNFNAVSEENAGKWANTEATRNQPTMGGVDTILNFAQSHGMYARLHNEIWDETDGNPSWGNTLLSNAGMGSSSAQTDLQKAITSRTNYYIAPTASQVGEVDVYNESYEGECCYGKSSFWKVYGASGVAGIYHEAQLAAPGVKLGTNGSNALIYPGGDGAAYFPHIEELEQAAITAGYGNVLGSIGTEHYPWSISMHNPSDILKAMQTLAITGLPQSITEFGIPSGVSQPDAATILGDVMRLEFGNPSGTGMFMWGFHSENGGGNLWAPSAALFSVNTNNWNSWAITPAGKVWQDLLGIQDWDGNTSNGWNTQLTANTDSGGKISFNGYYGDYTLTAAGKTYGLTLTKGTSNYAIGTLPGDFNFDGKVDARDYVLWRVGFGTTYTQADYANWRADFGFTAGSGLGQSAVPEPRVELVLVVLLLWRNRNRAQRPRRGPLLACPAVLPCSVHQAA
jgi:GH35 family endo-1,4-beta-xylanase